MDDIYAQTAAIHRIGFRVGDNQAVTLQKRFQGRQGVVFEMLMTDRVECVARQNLRQIMHFDDPHAFLEQHAGHVRHKIVGIFEIVKHGDRGNHAKAFA